MLGAWHIFPLNADPLDQPQNVCRINAQCVRQVQCHQCHQCHNQRKGHAQRGGQATRIIVVMKEAKAWLAPEEFWGARWQKSRAHGVLSGQQHEPMGAFWGRMMCCLAGIASSLTHAEGAWGSDGPAGLAHWHPSAGAQPTGTFYCGSSCPLQLSKLQCFNQVRRVDKWSHSVHFCGDTRTPSRGSQSTLRRQIATRRMLKHHPTSPNSYLRIYLWIYSNCVK